MKISFCDFNEYKDEVIKIIKKNYPEFETSVNRCIYSCGDCARKPIARINGELLVGENTNDLVQKIIEYSKNI
ncbi:YuzB family protein [Clostridium swellfunianum]|uniref:DUF1450 domain-containing protein n=1 Tax=Clostridium swellfunianum TaxID=1367462 RepID=UPI002030B2C8|nr:DUF1450 domain-containing protein [Clostridium swellfunianum]MCM0648371.1 YuzB family protein [Clostridium swellfunianum]